MISFHAANPQSPPGVFTHGFRAVDTDDTLRIMRCIIAHVWSPIHFKDGHRKQVNFIEANWCALDFETPEMTVEQAHNVFADRIHVIGITRNHRIEKGGVTLDRFRVLLKWEYPITDLRIYRWNMRQMTERYPCDPACRDGARFFFPCRAVTQMAGEGYLEEVDLHPPDWFDAELVPGFAPAMGEAGVMPRWVAWQLDREIPVGERNPTIFRMASDLTKNGHAEDAIVALVLNSKTYGGKAAPEVLRDIQKAVRNGARKAREQGYGR